MGFAINGVSAGPLTSTTGSETGAQAPARSLITGGINENDLATLWGNTRPEATTLNDRGALPDGFVLDHLLLQLQRSPEQEQALDNLIAQLHDRKSPLFHQWLTPEEFGAKYGLGQEDLGMIKNWLQSHGFTVNFVYANNLVIDFTGTAGEIKEAFHTELHQLSVNGEKHFANMSDPRIPAALAPAVLGVVSLNDFRPHQMKRLTKGGSGAQFTFGPNCGFLTSLRDGTNTYCEALMPQDLETIYNMNPVYSAGITGKGQTIVVIEDGDAYSLGDWGEFRKVAGLARAYPYGSIAQTHQGTGCTDPGDRNNGDDAEVAIDMEWSSAAAPNAAIVVQACTSLVTALNGIFNAPGASTTGPAIVSMSYGENEASNGATNNAAYNSAYQQGVTEGISIFVSSGDEGACSAQADRADCTSGITVSGLTSSPYDISVGGTDFGDAYAGLESTYWNSTNTADYGSAKSYIPEIPWNDSCADTLVINFLNAYYSSSLINGYGPSGTGVCNTYPLGGSTSGDLVTTASGSGGPSNCATGAASPTPSAPASGGTCAGYPKPSWQTLVGNPSDGVRDIPDVSLMAANGLWNHFYIICNSNPNPTEVAEGYSAPCVGNPVQNWPGFGGTSVSSPIWAGIQALVNQQTGQRWGQANTVYYAIANSEYGASGNPSCFSGPSPLSTPAASCVFNDVTQGTIYLPCATTGSDGAARLYNCYRPSATDSTSDFGVMSAAPETFPGSAGPGPVTALNVTAAGAGYSSAPTCALAGGAGTGATCSTSISGLVSTIAVTTAGTGYTSAPLCSITGGGGLGATCAATESGGAVTSITVENGGSGYTSTPTCSLVGGGGSGATCSATTTTGVTGITIITAGSGYTSDPTCRLTGGGFTTAATCASIINGVQTLAPQAYPAGVGWDFATGIGTVNAYNLVTSPLW
jgi:hypothetical protein